MADPRTWIRASVPASHIRCFFGAYYRNPEQVDRYSPRFPA